MKRKIIITLCLIAIALTGCSNKVSKSSEVVVDNKKISYYGDVDKYSNNKNINLIGSTGKFGEMNNNSNSKIDIYYNDSDIRAIVVNDSSVNTYKGIKVGDNKDKVADVLDYEKTGPSSIFAVFEDNKEIDSIEDANTDKLIYVNYVINGDIVSKIEIYDYKKANYGR